MIQASNPFHNNNASPGSMQAETDVHCPYQNYMWEHISTNRDPVI